jgi:hypothetical protein
MGNFSRQFKSFFKNHRKVWEQLAHDIGAKFVKNGLFKPFEVIKTQDNFTLKLDSVTKMSGNHVQYITRFQTTCNASADLYFLIVRKHFFNKKAPKNTESFNTDLEIFEQKFRLFVSSSREIRPVLNRKLLLNIAEQQPFTSIRLELKAKNLELTIAALVKDIDQLKSLFVFMKELRNQFAKQE